MKLSNEQKTEIAQSLRKYCERYPSQNKAAASIKGLSPGTLSSILSGKWELISDNMWLNVQSQMRADAGWRLYPTAAHEALRYFFGDAKEYANVIWVTGPAGIGKSTAAAEFERMNRNVFLLTCSEDMHKSDFVQELAGRVGVRTTGLTVRQSLRAIINELVKKERPLLIFDEGDKLTDSVLYYFVSLYNSLEDKCGMVFLSTNYMQERMRRGLSYGKKGYDELDSRICRKFVPLDLVGSDEVRAICELNGLSDKAAVRRVLSEADSCGNDLRRVKRCVHKELRMISDESSNS